ncbi:ABC transporter permease subunit [Nocardioides sp. B-3]|uniref:ABC transporter permease subunit n=1 Tax=Nocardioides sp. B-3 TaxID=2895565 RepID=UPI003FA5E0C9
MGVPTFKFKLLAFATGAFVGGPAGGLYATRQSFINPQSFLLLFSILFLAAVVVGGRGNRWGVIVGAIPGGLPASAVPRVRRLPRPCVRPGPGPARDAATRGSAAAATHGSRQAARARADRARAGRR